MLEGVHMVSFVWLLGGGGGVRLWCKVCVCDGVEMEGGKLDGNISCLLVHVGQGHNEASSAATSKPRWMPTCNNLAHARPDIHRMNGFESVATCLFYMEIKKVPWVRK